MKERILREHLADLLSGKGAHLDWKAAFSGIPSKLRGVRPGATPHSAWELLEHMRIAQWDILEFSRDAKHVSPEWPKGYWPDESEAGTDQLWSETFKKFRNDLAAFSDLISDPATDLFAEIPHGTGQTVLREALVLADHNSNHLGALIVMARLLKAT